MKNCEGAARCDLEDDPATWAVQTVSRAAVLCRSVELCCTNCHHDPGRLFRLDLGTMGLRSCFRSCTAPYTLIALMQLFQLRAGRASRAEVFPLRSSPANEVDPAAQIQTQKPCHRFA